ncbi:Tetratricopeptide repeat (TPR)-like superfamily protein [Euphorbia peplus]|nr:Tetratricopeptide repeat (TPR)-like superfamily protein [Euphorbia peplus]
MIYVHRLSSLVPEISRYGARNASFSNFHSKANRTSTNPKLWGSSTAELYRRITPLGDPKVSIVPVLDQWVQEGRSVQRASLIDIIRELRAYRRYHHALEVSMWMTDKRYYYPTSSDVAIRLGLISNAQGIKQAEKFFDSLSQKLNVVNVYGALLNCYATAKCVEKAEALMQKMNDLGFVMQTLNCNSMLTLYYKTGNFEKFDAFLKEMEANRVCPNNVTLALQLSACAAVMDTNGIDKIVRMMESDPEIPEWTSYTAAATGYGKAGLLDKALKMLKKAEACSKGNYAAYNNLITHYAKIGRKDDVLRLWSVCKKGRVYNKGYMRVLKSLVMLGDYEMAEEIFNEWESQDVLYDIQVSNIMIGAYSKQGRLDKAEVVLDRAISAGEKPDAWTWYNLVEGYLQNDQSQTVEMLKKAVGWSRKTRWKPDIARFKARLKYLKDAEKTEEFVKSLVDKDFFSLDKLEEVSSEI